MPFYAVLSHRWGPNEAEVKFEDLQAGDRKYDDKSKPGYDKLRFCYDQVMRSGLRYFWIDSCCIKKTDSSELARSLNSMFYWYQRATTCYVYLSDVSVGDATGAPGAFKWEDALAKSKWFTRGWTLQELLAPSSVAFFTCEGHHIGNKSDEMLVKVIANVAGLPTPALRGVKLSRFTVETRRSWAARRTTTVPEDAAYCLLGIFDVQMPLLYADGEYNKRRQAAMAELDRVIQNAPVDTTESVLRIGGASWNDLSRLGQRQLEALDADLEAYSKWLLNNFLDLPETLHITVPQLRKTASTKMRSLLANKQIAYDDLYSHATNTGHSDGYMNIYGDKTAAPHARIRASLEEDMYIAAIGENVELLTCITAIWTLEELMIWRGKWTRQSC